MRLSDPLTGLPCSATMISRNTTVTLLQVRREQVHPPFTILKLETTASRYWRSLFASRCTARRPIPTERVQPCSWSPTASMLHRLSSVSTRFVLDSVHHQLQYRPRYPFSCLARCQRVATSKADRAIGQCRLPINKRDIRSSHHESTSIFPPSRSSSTKSRSMLCSCGLTIPPSVSVGSGSQRPISSTQNACSEVATLVLLLLLLRTSRRRDATRAIAANRPATLSASTTFAVLSPKASHTHLPL